MAKSRGFYKDTRTGAVRQSSTKLGYPYIEATDEDVERLPGAPRSTRSSRAAKPSTGEGEGK